MIKVNDQITIEDWEISYQFTRASGPGGQHVNKTASAVEIRFYAARSPNLTAQVKNKLRQIAGQRWTSEGEIVFQVQDTRSQHRNREIAEARLADLIRAALRQPKKRRPTKPTRSSVRKRLDQKSERGALKKLRGKIDPES